MMRAILAALLLTGCAPVLGPGVQATCTRAQAGHPGFILPYLTPAHCDRDGRTWVWDL